MMSSFELWLCPECETVVLINLKRLRDSPFLVCEHEGSIRELRCVCCTNMRMVRVPQSAIAVLDGLTNRKRSAVMNRLGHDD